ncbi:hypothetical protein EHO60_14810 [Leptospira fletcheri]|uniref:Uncharacterized protein n=1 Tax=Leptospira fletcheri TaxID=2484981 RepID=A0A4R9G4H9_9LEPT|nr:hypothetical protein [Leptospira fletcheri]TGK06314.1 hypothetical protein EHO60_14810 [Leptospira fletcheri]
MKRKKTPGLTKEEIEMTQRIEEFRKRHERMSARGQLKRAKELFERLASYNEKFERLYTRMQKLGQEVSEIERKIRVIGLGEILEKLKGKQT